MRIVHVIHTYYPRVGGIERAVQCLAEEQAKLDQEVMVITSDVDVADSPKKEIIGGVNVVRLRSRRLLYNDLTIPLEESPIEDVDIVHVHSQNSLFALMQAEKLKERLNAKVAVHFMAVETLRGHPSPLVRLFGPYYGRRNTQKAIKLSDLKLARSLRDREILEEKYNVDEVYQLPDAVPNYYFSMGKGSSEEFKERFGIKQENIFLFIGRIHRLKGPQILIQALKYINGDIAVVFIGPDGGYAEETLTLAERIGVGNKVYMLGYVDEETKIHALDSAVALILPSITDYVEVYPMVISEAWARKKPVIASDVGGVPYRIRERMNGILVKPSDPKSLAGAMLELLRDDKLVREMGENGRGEVLFWREVAVRSVELYKLVFDYQKNER